MDSRNRIPAVLGAGLLIGGPPLPPDAAAAEVNTEFAGSKTLFVFLILVHGAAGVLLAGLGWSPSKSSTSRGLHYGVRCGSIAIMQLIGEAALIALPGSSNANTIWETITRIDSSHNSWLIETKTLWPALLLPLSVVHPNWHSRAGNYRQSSDSRIGAGNFRVGAG
ncbi:hypothetical protein ACFUCV_06185 [Specibacter sp. NPDC057265]|uniref:hypothetical protein n=1 Tax=Specibacter sp. NPDC057265 TaxID=3346075 RepID=UPI00362AEFA4